MKEINHEIKWDTVKLPVAIVAIIAQQCLLALGISEIGRRPIKRAKPRAHMNGMR